MSERYKLRGNLSRMTTHTSTYMYIHTSIGVENIISKPCIICMTWCSFLKGGGGGGG